MELVESFSQYPFSETAADRKANIIWFTVDQMRGQALSIMGDPNVQTPNIDRMSRDGTHFRNALSGCPLCCPARSCWMTGQYAHRAIPGHEYALNPEIPTVADAFNAAGYHTAWLGKWHLDGFHEKNGRAAWHYIPRERRGRFNAWIGYENNNFQYDCWVHGHDGDDDIPMHRLPGHESEMLTNMLIDQIDQHKDEPFFLSAALQPPHDPYTAPASYAGKQNPAAIQLRPNVPQGEHFSRKAREELSGYYALIEHIDAQVGRVMEHLEKTGLVNNTYLIFVSDHGDQHGSQGHFRKLTPHEESIRVPFLVWGGRRWTYRDKGAVPYVINHVDLAPTSLGLAGIGAAPDMQGFDYSGLFRDGRYPEGAPACGPDMSEAPNSAYMQMVIPPGHGPSADLPWRGVVMVDGWKYVTMHGQPWMMYDLNTDPYEQCNLAFHGHARAKRTELQHELAAWVKRTGDEFTLPEFRADGRPIEINQLERKFEHCWRE